MSAVLFLRAYSVSVYLQKLSQRVRLSAWTQTQFELDRKWLHQFVFAPCRGWTFHCVNGWVQVTVCPGFILDFFFPRDHVSDATTKNPACFCSQLSPCFSYDIKYISPTAELQCQVMLGWNQNPNWYMLCRRYSCHFQQPNLLLPGKA